MSLGITWARCEHALAVHIARKAQARNANGA